ncbi:MAG TPA: tetratricopeptide repeat protein [Candidatus Synoicihabitans sp.]|nr:tetratricopeptide repeat protein [Candidatus Synoicihabitans sp.]
MNPRAKWTALLQEALTHHQAGRLPRAEAGYRAVIALAPREPRPLELLAQLLTQQARTAEALAALQHAYRLDERSVPCGVRLGSSLIAADRAAEAERLLRRLTELVPQSAPAWNALGYTLRVLGRIEEAEPCHRRAVQLDPKFAEGWYHLGLAISTFGRNSEALRCHEEALAQNPKFARARFGRAQTLHKLYRTAEAIADYEAFLAAEPAHSEAQSYRLFAMQSLETLSPEQLFAEHRAYGERLGPVPPPLPPRNPDPERRLRLAILSPDLRTHSCAYFLEPLLRHLDPRQFEVVLYHDHFQEDEVSARLRRSAKQWRKVVGLSASALERLIRQDAPDILVDLSGHIGMTVRLPLFARRLAPVQVTYLGYPDTTGVPAMDYRFTDAIADPLEVADPLNTEQLVRFAPTAWVYQPPHDAPPAAPIPDGRPVTFGCFNSPTKFNDRVFSTWARLLESVPESRLCLKARDFHEPDVRASLLQRMERAGLSPARLDLLPRTASTADHLACYQGIDVALDTFPYGGTTTTCEALWMGRPVVTLAGNRHAARVGASLLHAIGHPEWVARDETEYCRIAADLISDRPALARAASGLRQQMARSPLRAEAEQSHRFATALRACWREQIIRHASATAA